MSEKSKKQRFRDIKFVGNQMANFCYSISKKEYISVEERRKILELYTAWKCLLKLEE